MATTFHSHGAATPLDTNGLSIVTAAAAVTAGDLIVLGVAGTSGNNPGVSSITDTIGNTYTQVNRELNAAATDWVEQYACLGSSGTNASNVVTVNFLSNTSFRRAGATAWTSTLGTSWSIDGTPGVQLSSTTSVSVSVGTNAQAEAVGFLITSGAGNATWTAGSGSTIRQGAGTDTIIEDKVFASSAAQALTLTATTAVAKWSCATMFKAGAAATIIRSLSSTGAGR